MKMTISPALNGYIGSLLSALDASMDEASALNDVMERGTDVRKMGGFLSGEELPLGPYQNDDYAKKMGAMKGKRGNLSLRYLTYPAFVPFVYDEIKLGKNFIEKTPFGYFAEDFRALALLEGERIWMSVTPHEINTMKKPIEEAHGNVLTLGLGLGYYAFHVLRKEEVRSLTIIEHDHDVIALFKEKLLPRFPHAEKLRIIEGDAFAELGKKSLVFDCLFADLWHFPDDGLPLYVKLLKMESLHPGAHFSYWIEKSILALIRRALIILLDECRSGKKDDSYLHASSMSDELINQLYTLSKGAEIESSADIDSFLSDASLKRFAYHLDGEILGLALSGEIDALNV